MASPDVQSAAVQHCDLYDFLAKVGHNLTHFVNSLAEISKAASWLGVIFSITALLIAVVIICRSERGTGIKLLGAIFVTGLCFAANNWSAYLLGIFIVATLVTELEFLEKLAAIFCERPR